MKGEKFSDWQERDRIASDLDMTFLVEAAAGTGKTTSLVTRMIALIREEKSIVSKIAAITFTRKAAAHLRQKFQNALEAAHSSETDPRARQKFYDALDQLDCCYIGTIHSFCAQLLRERPVEAGIGPDFKEIEGADEELLRDSCWHDYTERLFISGSPIIPEMERYGISFESLYQTYKDLCTYPDVIPKIAKVPLPDFSSARESIKRFLDDAEYKVPSEPHIKGRDGLQTLLLRAIRLSRILDLEQDTEFVKLLEVLSGSGGFTRYRWPDSVTAEEMQASFEYIKSNIVVPMLIKWREYLHPILIKAVIPAVESFTRFRKERSLLNFQDLLMMARDLLKENPHVRRYFRERNTHILVDEFQDTDPIQAELMLYLTGDDTEETDWRRIRPVPGSLFIVGDPKQSIYRFRRADITAYNCIRDIIERAGGQVLKLATNFRSCESICKHVNTLFKNIFPASATEEQAAYVALSHRWTNAGQISGVYKLELSTSQIRSKLNVDRVRKEDILQMDSKAIAEWINSALVSSLTITESDGSKRPVTPGDFLIVLYEKEPLSFYAQTLESYGIPFEISGSNGFKKSDEIAMLVPFLKSVVDPDDALSILAYLRGPLCGASDSAIYNCKRAGGRFSYIEDTPEGIDEHIVTAFNLLREAREWSRKLPPAAALSRICERLGILPYAASLKFGEIRCGNLLKMLSIARQLSMSGVSFAGIVSRIQEFLNKDNIEEMGIAPGRTDAVRLMNLHKAKGLEAPIVFLAGPTEPKDHPPKYHVDRSVDPPQGHFLITKKIGGFQHIEVARPLDWDLLASIEKRFEHAEDDRLLYVAATRPMNALVISVYWNESGGNPGPRGLWCKLLTDDIRDLPGIEVDTIDTSKTFAFDTPSEYNQACAQISRKRSKASMPGYAVTHVTKVAHSSDSAVVRNGTGHGVLWGRVLHSCLESAMRKTDTDIRTLALNLMRQEEASLDDLDDIVRLVESVRASDLWKQACASEKCLVEVPFALSVPGSDLGQTDGPAQTVLSGVIDLVFRDGDGWIIVDYKSDVIGSHLTDLINKYSPQVKFYKKYWEQLTGEPVKAALFFVDNGHVEWIQE